jgi:RsiW-degrading membrane proteinase PrsW (M82 family)
LISFDLQWLNELLLPLSLPNVSKVFIILFTPVPQKNFPLSPYVYIEMPCRDKTITKEGLKIVSSEYREPLGSADQPDQNISSSTSLNAQQGQQETLTTPIKSEQFGVWNYCEQSNYSGYMQQPRPPAYPGGYPYQGQYPQPGAAYPCYPPYPGYGGYPGYTYPGYPAYPKYPMPPYIPYVQRPPRNGYQLTMALISLISSILIIFVGFFCMIIILMLNMSVVMGYEAVAPKYIFSVNILLTGILCACIIGGAFGIYHSIRALIQHPSRPFRLPPFWGFLGAYAIVLAIGLFVGENAVVIDNPLLVAFPLIALSGMLPALTFLAYVLWRLHCSSAHTKPGWPTTWRRFTMALVSGATIAIALAIFLEYMLGKSLSNIQIDDPSSITIDNPTIIVNILILVSVIAPLVEEALKPLAVITMIGRIQNATEAFILGMTCGLGFDMIETISYISSGEKSWIAIAIGRSTAGLLHGVGAGMMALGWHYLTQKKALQQRRLLIAFGCMLYAILQHAIWNGSFLLMLIPGPIGDYLLTGKIVFGNYTLDSFWLVYLFLSALILAFLWFVTGKLQRQANVPPEKKMNQPNSQPTHQPIPVPAGFAPMPWQ